MVLFFGSGGCRRVGFDDLVVGSGQRLTQRKGKGTKPVTDIKVLRAYRKWQKMHGVAPGLFRLAHLLKMPHEECRAAYRRLLEAGKLA